MAVPKPSSRPLVVIPAWNEEETIADTVSRARVELAGIADLLVVNDGSNDRTGAICDELDVMSIHLPFNMGVGGALRAGIRFAIEHDYDGVVQVDADGQHPSDHVVQLLADLDKYDVVIGSRFKDGGDYNADFLRRVVMRYLSWSLSRMAKAKLTDTTSGFRAMGPAAMELFAQDLPVEYLGDTVESIVIGAKAGLSFHELATPMKQRAGGQPSQSVIAAAGYAVRAVFILWIAQARVLGGGSSTGALRAKPRVLHVTGAKRTT